MAADCSRFVRFQDDAELAKLPTTNGGNGIKPNETQVAETSGEKGLKKDTRKFLKARVLSRVFSEDYEKVRKRTLLDPRAQTIHRWNKILLFLGASWYLLSIERQEACWRSVCDMEEPSCQYGFFDCKRVEDSLRASCSLGQGLLTSTFVGEIMFAIVVATLGLVLFGLLIGNMQTYLQSTTVRLEEWRVRRTDTEQWMHHRQLPPELRQSVRKYNQYKWLATRGVDEEALLKGLPADLRRDIKRHLCLELVRRVPLFDQMDERMLDAICERLKPALCTENTYLVREGDPVNETLFIIRGHLDSYTTNGGRTGFFNSCHIGPGDFCGEELLTWALGSRPSFILPSSTRTVKAISEVEAFALMAEDLKFVASQFRRLHSKQLRHKFRFYSHQWRTWAACFVQAAWRRYKKRKEAAELRARENVHEGETAAYRSGLVVVYATRMARKGVHHVRSGTDSGVSLQKPEEPDFSVDE
ncbi:hypothetical protein JHK85_033798 [Glycine max]|nr:hypothetical protein JHK85_033798 [Glycine max]